MFRVNRVNWCRCIVLFFYLNFLLWWLLGTNGFILDIVVRWWRTVPASLRWFWQPSLIKERERRGDFFQPLKASPFHYTADGIATHCYPIDIDSFQPFKLLIGGGEGGRGRFPRFYATSVEFRSIFLLFFGLFWNWLNIGWNRVEFSLDFNGMSMDVDTTEADPWKWTGFGLGWSNDIFFSNMELGGNERRWLFLWLILIDLCIDLLIYFDRIALLGRCTIT